MKIRVLGCSGAIAAGSRTTAFLLDQDVLIDAGTGVGDLSLQEMAHVDHILLSHSHLDHVLGVALLADSVIRRRRRHRRPPIQVHALPATLDALRRHIFNGIIWPDFTRLPSAESPVLKLVPIGVGDQLMLGDRRIEVLPAEHAVPAVGFAVHASSGAWVFTGDTGPNPALWEHLAGVDVAHLVIETAFGEEEADLASVSAHLCPSTLATELQAAPPRAAVYLTHVKPGEMETVLNEVKALPTGRTIDALRNGQVFELG